MSAEFVVLGIVVVTALAFDFTNGFHDTANAMSASIATGALKPRAAVALSAVLNLAGAFLSVEVAATVGKGIIKIGEIDGSALITVVFAGLVGGILWNVFTWFLGIPSSSSHALIGGLIGSTVIAVGLGGISWGDGVLAKVLLPAVLAPIVAGTIAALATRSVYRATRAVADGPRDRGFRLGQIGSASLISLAHGTNDAQKTMGVIFLALVAYGSLTPNDPLPFWVKLACAIAIAAGTYIGGWRIIRTLGKGLVNIEAPQGLAADSSSAAIILTSSHFGLPLSTTHVATGSILGSGVGRGAPIRWSVAGRLVMAWVMTLPLAGATGAICWFITDAIGGVTGVLMVFGILLIACLAIYVRSRRNRVDTTNVTADWDDVLAPSRKVP